MKIFITIFMLLSSTQIFANGKELIENKCGRCHKPGKAKGDLDLVSLMPNKQGILPSTHKWRRALAYLESHEMPPADTKKIPSAERKEMISWLEATLFRSYMSYPETTNLAKVRRLNNKEYVNTLKDLLYLKEKPVINLLADNSGYGFDNIADLLSLSPLSMEKYLQHSKDILNKAVLDSLPTRKIHVYDAESMDRPDKNIGRVIAGFHLVWSNGLLTTNIDCDSAGEYTFILKAAGNQAGEESVHIDVMLNSKKKQRIQVSAVAGSPESYEFKLNLSKGSSKLDLVFVNDYLHVKSDRNFHFYSLGVSGPSTLPSLPDSHRKLAPKGEDIKVTLKKFLARAYRRPPSDTELTKYLAMYHKLNNNGSNHLIAIKACFMAALNSPKFLFRIESSSEKEDYALASRLSYFLWSSMPDERLFDLANKGELHKPEVLNSEVERMLNSYRSTEFTNNFSGQWLHVRNLNYSDIDKKQFPAWGDSLKSAMEKEVYDYFSHVLTNNLPLKFFIRGDKLFVNDKLAKLYGLKGQFDNKVKAVAATSGRDSILTTAAVLTVTSEASRTSPVKRGKWILEELLGFTPPPPPPGIPGLEEIVKNHETKTISEQMALHREDPDCSVCHLRMDPLGLSFEHYGPLGQWRQAYKHNPIVAGGHLPDGAELKGVPDVQDYLLQNERAFQINFIKKLMTYALGRGIEESDYRHLYKIHSQTVDDGCRLRQLVKTLVVSKAFNP